jgi:gamma-glutamylcyclotransferase (GGCT)/AIG2-like uncharacterized protein YtfP
VIDNLFVYGSLRSECDNPNARLLREQADSLGRATVQGSIFRVETYSAFQHQPDGIVQGELWRLHDPDKTLAALDDYEGPEFSRRATTATTSDGTSASTWIYVYGGHVRPDWRIHTGDFFSP